MSSKPMLISVEGNIATGKSTLFEYIKTLGLPIYFVDEPVSEWLQIKDKNNINALQCFYQDQKRNSFCFQILAYITRLKKLMDAIKAHPNSIIMSERCIETDKYVFAKMLYEADYINSIEWETYNYWYNSFSDVSKVDLILYINTSPEECYKRISVRNRTEETSISLEYLQQCHLKHEEWLKSCDIPIVNIDGNNMIEDIRIQVNKIMTELVSTRSETICTSY